VLEGRESGRKEGGEGGGRGAGKPNRLPDRVPVLGWGGDKVVDVVFFLVKFEGAMRQEGVRREDWVRALWKSAEGKQEVREVLQERLEEGDEWEKMKQVLMEVVLKKGWKERVEEAFRRMSQKRLSAEEFQRRVKWVGEVCGAKERERKRVFCRGLREGQKASVYKKWALEEERWGREWEELVRQAAVEEELEEEREEEKRRGKSEERGREEGGEGAPEGREEGGSRERRARQSLGKEGT
jgi:hypothetical protein